MQANAIQLQSQGKLSELLAVTIGPDGGPAPNHVQPIFTSGGGVLFVQNPDSSYDTKQMEMGSQGSINAMTKIGQMGAAGLLKTSIGADNVATLFTVQKAAFVVSGPWNLPAVVKSGVTCEISDLPKFACRRHGCAALHRCAEPVCRSQGQEQGAGAGVRDQLLHPAGSGEGAVRRVTPATGIAVCL